MRASEYPGMSNALQASFRHIILLGRSASLLIRNVAYILGMNTKCNPLTWKFGCKCDPVSEGGREKEREIKSERERERARKRSVSFMSCSERTLIETDGSIYILWLAFYVCFFTDEQFCPEQITQPDC